MLIDVLEDTTYAPKSNEFVETISDGQSDLLFVKLQHRKIAEASPFLQVTTGWFGGTPMTWKLHVFFFHQDYFDFPDTFSTLVPRPEILGGKLAQKLWNWE